MRIRCNCTLASRQVMQWSRTQLLPWRLPAWSTLWQQLLTDPRRADATAISAQWPVSSRHAALFWACSRAPQCCSGWNSGNWFVNILKCGRAVNSRAVIPYFQRICRSCWSEDYCTYRNHLTTKLLLESRTFSKWNNLIITLFQSILLTLLYEQRDTLKSRHISLWASQW